MPSADGKNGGQFATRQSVFESRLRERCPTTLPRGAFFLSQNRYELRLIIRMQTDEQIVDAVLSGERAAFAELVRRYERQVHAVVWGVLRDHHAAEDVMQEVFVKAYERLGEWRGGAMGAWLVVMAKRAAIDQVRRGRRVVSEVSEVAVDAVVEEDAAAVMAAVGRLGEREQKVVLLRYFSGMSVAEIAGVMGCPVGTVTKRLSRAIERLRDFLRADE